MRSAKLTPRSDGGYQIAVVLRARVLDRSGASDRGFRAEVDIGHERFLDGESVTLAVRSSRPARIYVLGITEEGAALLLPNAHVRDTRVVASRPTLSPPPWRTRYSRHRKPQLEVVSLTAVC